MPGHEPAALWEQALEGPDTDTLADRIAALAVSWAGGDPERLREAERILGRTPYLESPAEPSWTRSLPREHGSEPLAVRELPPFRPGKPARTLPGPRTRRETGQNLRLLRRRAGLTQEELAAEVNARGYESSWYQSTVARIEDGRRHIRLFEGRALAEVLGMSLDQLVTALERGEES